MGKIIDEYMDIKLQQKCVSKTIDTLWKMAQKYQKIEQIMNQEQTQVVKDTCLYKKIKEVIEDGNKFIL